MSETIEVKMSVAEARLVRDALARHLRVVGRHHPDAALASELGDRVALAVMSVADAPLMVDGCQFWMTVDGEDVGGRR